ncbi:unnamed protein product [Gongylonema pulchrum]|uniref:t-SNARE coiled-coil homology domain-containing protein n=1 Tax=Gongylonema pulchrum TaxID=637853 RepID=A0A183DRA8_9BILA|nr:unnamed protein product [Gongylonema pulchrum]
MPRSRRRQQRRAPTRSPPDEYSSPAADSNYGIRRSREGSEDKLMERHLMSKKITELNNVLEKINGATNKVMIEMDNRVDDLNRDWQKRLQSQNFKWKDRISALSNYDNRAPQDTARPSGDSFDIGNSMWRTERRLTEIVDRLSSIPRMEKNLETIIKMVNRSYYYRPHAKTVSLRQSDLSQVFNRSLQAF